MDLDVAVKFHCLLPHGFQAIPFCFEGGEVRFVVFLDFVCDQVSYQLLLLLVLLRGKVAAKASRQW